MNDTTAHDQDGEDEMDTWSYKHRCTLRTNRTAMEAGPFERAEENQRTALHLSRRNVPTRREKERERERERDPVTTGW